MENKPKYNVLMLGWEFYPVFAGGMGVVTSEIVSGLTAANIGVHFVIPRLPQKIIVDRVNLISAEDYIAHPSTVSKTKEYVNSVKKTYVDTEIMPYGANVLSGEKLSSDLVSSSNTETQPKSASSKSNPKSLYHSDLFRDIKMFEDRTVEIALESDYDLIHAHDWMTFKAAIKAKNVTGKPVVLHVHAMESDRSGDNPNMVILNIERECLQQADYVIAVSKKVKEDIIKNYNIDANKIFVIHNSTNFYQAHNRSILSQQDKIVLFLGRITMQKGPEYFIYAAAKVLLHAPKTLFVMAGDGDAFKKCIDLINDLGIEKNFIFTGFLVGDKKSRLYASADLFVMPSVSEPFGVVALEAIKSGTPVIVSKTSGAAEIIYNSLTVDFWDINKMADMMHSVLKYQSLHDELIENQSEDLESQNWNHQIDVLMRVYELAKSSHV